MLACSNVILSISSPLSFFRDSIALTATPGILTINEDPAPTLLVTEIVPFIFSTSRFEIASPNPTPPYILCDCPDCCPKASKIITC